MENGNQQKYIVLVEDEETLANIMQVKLEKAGYRVGVAKNGFDGLALIRASKPDLVLLDLMLPGMNGETLLEELVKDKLLPDLPVIVISNSGQPVEINKIIGFGVRDYLIKVNFNPSEVLSKIEQVFSSVRGAAGPAILIIEDDAILVDLLERKFSQKFAVCKAANVAEARRILKERKIAAVLLDIVLPDVDGFTFLEELKKGEGTAHIPVIIISNLGQKEEIERGTQLGAAGYIIKANVYPQEILEKVEAIIQAPK